MLSAKLIKALERRGFFLEFPDYNTNEEIIIDILRQENARLNLSLPIFFIGNVDYEKIFSNINSNQKKELKTIMIICENIYKKEYIPNNIKEILKERKIKTKISRQEFEKYYKSFKEIQAHAKESERTIIEKQSKLRLNLDLNKGLAVLFSPSKIRIMKKIFDHEKLTNTELKYYYKAISNINKAVLTPALQEYVRVIETSKKLHEKK